MNRIADYKLIDFDQFLLLVILQFFLSFIEFLIKIIDFFMGLVSLLLEFRFFTSIFFNFLIILTDLLDSLEIFVIIFYHSDIRLLIFIF